MTGRPEAHFGLGKSIVFSVIIVSLFLGVAELGVRAWSYFLRDPVRRFDLETETFVLIPGEHDHGFLTSRVNSDGFVGPELREDSPNLWRIATVGDSCTFGDGSDEGTYPAMLQRILDERAHSSRSYEVVNAGIEGLNSELALRRLRHKVLPLHPDVATIYIGWNDLMKVDPLGQTDAAENLSHVARFLDGFWLVKGLRKLLFFYVRPLLRPPATGPESRTGRFAGFQPTVFEQNLRSMIGELREAGSQPLIVTLPTVLRPEMTTADLKSAGVIFPYFASAYGVGDLLDLIAAYNQAIRRVARELDVPLVDLAVTFGHTSQPTRYFFDTMHARREGLAVIAEQLFEGLERARLLGVPAESVVTEERWTGH